MTLKIFQASSFYFMTSQLISLMKARDGPINTTAPPQCSAELKQNGSSHPQQEIKNWKALILFDTKHRTCKAPASHPPIGKISCIWIWIHVFHIFWIFTCTNSERSAPMQQSVWKHPLANMFEEKGQKWPEPAVYNKPKVRNLWSQYTLMSWTEGYTKLDPLLSKKLYSYLVS